MGLKPGYDPLTTHAQCEMAKDSAYKTICEFCDEVGLGVTVEETRFIYTNGGEPGMVIGLINYPRFEATKERVKALSMELAKKLMKLLKQERVSIMYPDVTIMIEKEDL